MSTPNTQIFCNEFVADAQRRGEVSAAARLIERAEALHLDAASLRALSELLIEAGFLRAALALLESALQKFPDVTELRYARANALRGVAEFDRAEVELRDVLRHDPAHRDATYSLAYMLREQGRINAAADVVGALWRNAPTSADDALAALTFLAESGAQTQAVAIVDDARRCWSDDARLAARGGEIALALGAFDDAAAALRFALDRDPNFSTAWLRLAHCRRFSDPADADLQRFAQGWRDVNLDPTAQICVGFALGKALDDLGDYAQAANVLSVANARARKMTKWRDDDWQRLVQSDRNNSTLPRLAAHPGFTPVFIVGLPRTGTTLVAGALGRLPAVRDRGELNWIPTLYAHLQEHGQLHDKRVLSSVAQLIRMQMCRDDAPAQFYIDKNPLNFRYLDFIAALFPNAKIVHCRRGPRDTALSLWMQHFAHEDLGFSYDFSTIAQVDNVYRTLMAQWDRAKMLDTIEVDYEDFVSQPMQQASRLAEFLGVSDSITGPRATSTGDVVTTASVWQVRQPVYTHAVQRWRRYAPHLPELTNLFAE